MGISLFIIGMFFSATEYCKHDRVVEEYRVVENNNPVQIMKGGGKATELQLYNDYVWFTGVPLCSTIVVWSTSPFDEMTITWNNRPAGVESLSTYKGINYPGWYSFSSTALTNYVNNHVGDTIPFYVEIYDRNGGVCDIVWYPATRQSSNVPKLIHNSTTYSSIGDAWVSDGPPLGPNTNTGTEVQMLVCSCTLTTNSGTQVSYVEFYIPPPSTEEESGTSSFIFESQPNPFSSCTHIYYTVPYNEEEVILMVYNVMGRLVKTLVNETQPIGRHEVIWDGKNEKGAGLSSGYYFYRLKVGEKTFTAKSLLLRL